MKNLSDYCNAMLFSLIGDHELVVNWWNTPNRAFEGQCPCDIDENTVKSYLEGQCFGQ